MDCAPLIWTASHLFGVRRLLFGVRRLFPHLTILACVAALSPCARVPVAFPAHHKSAATHAKVTECGTGRRTPNGGGAFPLRSCSSGFPGTLQKRRHACKGHRMRNEAAQSKLGVVDLTVYCLRSAFAETGFHKHPGVRIQRDRQWLFFRGNLKLLLLLSQLNLFDL